MTANKDNDDLPETIPVLIHKLRNTLSPLKAFLDVVEIPRENTKLVEFHRVCLEAFQQAQSIIAKMETR